MGRYQLMALQMPPTKLTRGEISVGLLMSLSAFCLAGLVVICVVGWLLSRRSKRSSCHVLKYNEQEIVNGLHDDNAMDDHRRTSRSVLYRVPLQGSGGISRAVVVKMFQNESGTVDAGLHDRCQSELNLLGGICHDNIINLAGCIPRDNCILLVYDHMENGSLHQWLHPPPLAEGEQRRNPPLDWPTRRAIAIGVARGMCHLHHGCKRPIVHHNINSNSILLDSDLKAKIAGFGLARINLAGLDHQVPAWDLTAANIFGYTAPEYTTEVTQKVDVYSFGVVLLELVTGRLANEAVRDGHLATWAQKNCKVLMKNKASFNDVVDQDIPDRARYLEEMAAVFRLGVGCTVRDTRKRPSMQTVLHCLRRRGRGRFGALTCYISG